MASSPRRAALIENDPQSGRIEGQASGVERGEEAPVRLPFARVSAGTEREQRPTFWPQDEGEVADCCRRLRLG